jgi:hypothetical protein
LRTTTPVGDILCDTDPHPWGAHHLKNGSTGKSTAQTHVEPSQCQAPFPTGPCQMPVMPLASNSSPKEHSLQTSPACTAVLSHMDGTRTMHMYMQARRPVRAQARIQSLPCHRLYPGSQAELSMAQHPRIICRPSRCPGMPQPASTLPCARTHAHARPRLPRSGGWRASWLLPWHRGT